MRRRDHAATLRATEATFRLLLDFLSVRRLATLRLKQGHRPHQHAANSENHSFVFVTIPPFAKHWRRNSSDVKRQSSCSAFQYALPERICVLSQPALLRATGLSLSITRP